MPFFWVYEKFRSQRALGRGKRAQICTNPSRNMRSMLTRFLRDHWTGIQVHMIQIGLNNESEHRFRRGNNLGTRLLPALLPRHVPG